VDVASSVNALYTEQAVANIKAFIDDQDAIPSQVDISAGSVTLQNGGSFGINFPYGNTVQRDFVTLAQNTITNNVQTISPSISGYWQAVWNITPVGDAVTLSRLRAMYRYVTNSGRIASFEDESKQWVELETLLKKQGQEEVMIKDYDKSAALSSYGTTIDVSGLVEPRCVICLNSEEIRQFFSPKINYQDAAQKVADLDKSLRHLDHKLRDPMVVEFEKRTLAEYAMNDHLVENWPSFHINPTLSRVRLIEGDKRCSGDKYVYLGKKGENELCISKKALSYFVLFLLPQGAARSQVSPSAAADGKK
jgi:hypothetical protein